MSASAEYDLVVLGSGPGGYSAAFRAADLGLNVALIERYPTLGGVCLNVGCIPSKALLHMARFVTEAGEMAAHGIEVGKPKIDLTKIRAYKDGVIKKLTGGLSMMAKQRKVTVITGYGRFTDANTIAVTEDDTVTDVKFKQCIIAAGSHIIKLPFIPDDPRILDSTTALDLAKVDGELLVMGGGIIGLEMATVYSAFGSQISIVEMMDQLIPGADPDVVKPYYQRLQKQYHEIMLETKVTKVEAKEDGLWVTFEGANVPAENPKRYDQILMAVGRAPNGNLLDASAAGIEVDKRGFIAVNNELRTNVSHIFAIGDIIGQPMLAHKASHEGHIAAEVAAGMKHVMAASCIPAVAYTDPEIAWVGMSETEAKAKGVKYQKAVFPWMASGRAIAMNRTEGFTKLLFNEDGRIIGGAIIGLNAGELISEITLAIEMGCDAEDLGLTIHPHPTLAESVMMAAEVFSGSITDLYIPKKKKK